MLYLCLILLSNLNRNYPLLSFDANVKHCHDQEAETLLFLLLSMKKWEDHMQKFKLKCELGVTLTGSAF